MNQPTIARLISVGVVVGVTVAILVPLVQDALDTGREYLRDLAIEQNARPLEILVRNLPDACEHGIGRLDGADPSVARTVTCRVTFDRPFASPPQVTLALAGLDIADNDDGSRLRLHLSEVGSDGFDFNVVTWHTTGVGAAWVNWIAVGRR